MGRGVQGVRVGAGPDARACALGGMDRIGAAEAAGAAFERRVDRGPSGTALEDAGPLGWPAAGGGLDEVGPGPRPVGADDRRAARTGVRAGSPGATRVERAG
ncbi:hypothetical protein Pla163_02610 [Planctomycetes bacterium Pla163]|uniref:Uncharacterized protein n=1 Tax=Rohdeia mirabilis TaxID=2528008 RepID=A0A518CVC9_9BACT|nr:hypothetical protein Pla163_02610 [Planctomycetes bacterium Pla163]